MGFQWERKTFETYDDWFNFLTGIERRFKQTGCNTEFCSIETSNGGYAFGHNQLLGITPPEFPCKCTVIECEDGMPNPNGADNRERMLILFDKDLGGLMEGFVIKPKKFTLRAECGYDIVEFVRLAADRISDISFEASDEIEIKDKLSFNSNMSRGEIMAIIRKVPGGHVMLQTIQPTASYTGERDFDIE